MRTIDSFIGATLAIGAVLFSIVIPLAVFGGLVYIAATIWKGVMG